MGCYPRQNPAGADVRFALACSPEPAIRARTLRSIHAKWAHLREQQAGGESWFDSSFESDAVWNSIVECCREASLNRDNAIFSGNSEPHAIWSTRQRVSAGPVH